MLFVLWLHLYRGRLLLCWCQSISVIKSFGHWLPQILFIHPNHCITRWWILIFLFFVCWRCNFEVCLTALACLLFSSLPTAPWINHLILDFVFNCLRLILLINTSFVFIWAVLATRPRQISNIVQTLFDGLGIVVWVIRRQITAIIVKCLSKVWLGLAHVDYVLLVLIWTMALLVRDCDYLWGRVDMLTAFENGLETLLKNETLGLDQVHWILLLMLHIATCIVSEIIMRGAHKSHWHIFCRI